MSKPDPIIDFEPVGQQNAEENPKKSQATLLVEIAEQAELFHDVEGEGYARLELDNHTEFWPVRSKGFRDWLTRQFWLNHHKKSPSAGAIADALNVIQSIAKYDGHERPVFMRVAEYEENIYLDLCDKRWRCIEVTPHGWQILDKAPVLFIRHRKMLPLPCPKRGGSIDELWGFLNVTGEERVLVVGWLIQALRPAGTYPVLCLQGTHGTAKTTATRLLRRLIDPSKPDVRSPPKSEDDLFVSAMRNHVIAFDNLSGIQPWLSDALCRIATGGGINKRALFTNDEEHVVEALKPIVLNGIDDLAARQDLISRSIILNLDYIPEERRQEEEVFWEAFDEASPRILGALLDLISAGLKNLPKSQLAKLPRMADFAKWATAALGQEFIETYQGNIEEAVEQGLEGSPVANTLRLLMEGVSEWEGTSSELLRELEQKADIQTRQLRSWPRSAKGLTGQLKRLSTALRLIGLHISFRRTERSRTVTIAKFEDKAPDMSYVSGIGKNPATARAGGMTDSDSTSVMNDESSVRNDTSEIDMCHGKNPATARAGGPFTPPNDRYDTYAPYSSNFDLDPDGEPPHWDSDEIIFEETPHSGQHPPPNGDGRCSACSGEGCCWCDYRREVRA